MFAEIKNYTGSLEINETEPDRVYFVIIWHSFGVVEIVSIAICIFS